MAAGRDGQRSAYRRAVDVAEGRLLIPVAIAAEQADAVAFNNRTEIFLTALREDVTTRSVWQPDRPSSRAWLRWSLRRNAR